MSGSKNEVDEGAKTEEKEEEFDIKEIYTPLSVAKEEIWRRWNDKALRKKVEDFLGGDIPEFLKDEPKAYFARQIISPNFELFHFLKLAVHSDLDFVLPEWREDYFDPRNSCKYYLGKLFFHHGRARNNDAKLSTKRVVDFNKINGNKLASIETIWGENLIDFHHRLLCSFIPEANKKIHDLSLWVKRNGGSIEKFYINFMALFIQNGILFENFLTNKEEVIFTNKVILPSFCKINKLFGLKPLIVRTLPEATEGENYWFHYPDIVEGLIKNQVLIKKK